MSDDQRAARWRAAAVKAGTLCAAPRDNREHPAKCGVSLAYLELLAAGLRAAQKGGGAAAGGAAWSTEATQATFFAPAQARRR